MSDLANTRSPTVLEMVKKTSLSFLLVCYHRELLTTDGDDRICHRACYQQILSARPVRDRLIYGVRPHVIYTREASLSFDRPSVGVYTGRDLLYATYQLQGARQQLP